MEPTSHSRSSIDIGVTAAKHSGIVQQLIAADAVSGCDTTKKCDSTKPETYNVTPRNQKHTIIL